MMYTNYPKIFYEKHSDSGTEKPVLGLSSESLRRIQAMDLEEAEEYFKDYTIGGKHFPSFTDENGEPYRHSSKTLERIANYPIDEEDQKYFDNIK